ncbi:hypothetical protein [Radiobacillus sp. PE A8.2]
MILLVVGALLSGITGLFVMSMMVVAKRADQINEERRNIYLQHP